MLDTPMMATRELRLDQRARCYEEVMLEIDVENEMTFLTFDPPVTSKSVGQADTCIDLVPSLLPTPHKAFLMNPTFKDGQYFP